MDGATESARLAVLARFEVLDTAPEPLFDSLTTLAAKTFDVPIALISLLDSERQWFKSRVGIEAEQTARDISFCKHAILSDAPLIVLDTHLDPRFADTALVKGAPHIRFYAGAPLITAEGHRLGTLCVIDSAPRREFPPADVERLQALAASVIQALELRLAAIERERIGAISYEREALLAQAERLAGVGTWTWDVEANRTTWSEEVYRIHGYDPSETAPDLAGVLACYDPASATELGEKVQRAVSHAEDYELQARIIRPDGEIRDVVARGGCRLGKDGKVAGLFGTFQDVTALRLADLALRESEAKARHLIENSTDMIVRNGRDGVTREVSPACRQYGYEPDELKVLNPRDFIHPDDLAIAYAARLDNFSGREPDRTLNREYRIRTKSGDYRWVQGNPTPVRDRDGTVVEVISVFRDVTDRKLTEERLLASEAKARHLIENSTDMMVRMDQSARILEVSPACRAFGYEPSDLVDQLSLDFIHPGDLDAAIAAARDNFTGKPADLSLSREYRFRTKSGDYRWLQGSPTVTRDAGGVPLELISTFRDVTERKEAELALAEKEAHYRLLAENARDIIACYGPDARITYVSPAVSTVLGFQADELIGTTPTAFMHREDAKSIVALLAAYAADGPEAAPITYEYRAYRKDGQMIWLEGRPRSVFDPESGALLEFQDAVRDITRRKVMEADLASARDEAVEAIAVKSDFLANMSHEIRTPLTAILGFSSLLLARTDLAETAAVHVKRVHGASNALLAIVNDILDFSKLEAGQMSISPFACDVSEVAQDAMAMFSSQAEAKSLWLEFEDVTSLTSPLLVDPHRLQQILLNLIGNAIKFTDEGVVRLRMAYDPARMRLRFEVKDTGSGMDEIQSQKLFQRFSQVDASSTRKHGGTGLGLAISKALVEAMDGEIGVESLPGQGSTFHFEIAAPICEAKSPVDVAEAPSLESFADLRVLVADDNSANRELVRLLLAQLGADVSEAVDGQQVLDLCADCPFDVILLDLNMPVMGGVEALSRLRSGDGPNQDVPVLAFTANPADKTLGVGSGFDGIVSKPVKVADLALELDRVTGWQDPSHSFEVNQANGS